MNSKIEKLAAIAQKSSRLIVGLMSGTSMDGLDIALCKCDGNGKDTRVRILNFRTIAYQEGFKRNVKAIFSQRDADLQEVCIMNAEIALFHADLILSALKEWDISPGDIDLIASHGQTIFHAPRSYHQLSKRPDATLQIGDGDHLAVKTGIITISDFRQKHLAAGGEGAPLAVYGDYLLFSESGQNRIMLNIGGISNFTYLPADGDASKVFSTDIGPGNTLMDQFVQKNYPGLQYDEDAALAQRGIVNESLLAALLENEFFDLPFPKTTGPELFSLAYLEEARTRSGTVHISREDVMATLCRFSAESIVAAIKKTFTSDDNPYIYLSGGGMHNPLLSAYLAEGLPFPKFADTQQLGIDPDAKEAVLFAVLANETVAGKPINFGNRRGVPSVCMGKISLPE